jgi:MYXO-CTERM domain-containing protein
MLLVGCGGSNGGGGDGRGGGGGIGGGGGVGGGGGGSSVSLNEFPQKYAEALCGKNFQCCDASELAGKTMSTCVTDNAAVIGILVSEINESQTKGRVSYDAANTGACIDSLKNLTCDQFKQGIGENTAACMAFIMPKVAMGGACLQDFECITGNCQGADSLAEPPVDGMCAAAAVLAALGASCAASDCVTGAYCDSGNICQPVKAAGETCSADDECVNTCNTTTYRCSCYAGCQVGAGATTGGTLLSLALLGVGFVVTRRRRGRRTA